jgi:hypothetical protein
MQSVHICCMLSAGMSLERRQQRVFDPLLALAEQD